MKSNSYKNVINFPVFTTYKNIFFIDESNAVKDKTQVNLKLNVNKFYLFTIFFAASSFLVLLDEFSLGW